MPTVDSLSRCLYRTMPPTRTPSLRSRTGSCCRPSPRRWWPSTTTRCGVVTGHQRGEGVTKRQPGEGVVTKHLPVGAAAQLLARRGCTVLNGREPFSLAIQPKFLPQLLGLRPGYLYPFGKTHACQLCLQLHQLFEVHNTHSPPLQSGDLYLFDEFQTSWKSGGDRRRPPCK